MDRGSLNAFRPADLINLASDTSSERVLHFWGLNAFSVGDFRDYYPG